MLKRRRLLILSVVVILLIITLYVRSVSVARNNIFRQTDCPLPCWYDIRPGESTEKEFLDSVAKFPQNFTSLRYFENDSGIGYQWFDEDLRLHLAASIIDDHVRVIRINAANQVSLGQLFATVGEPSMYNIEITGGDKGSFFAFFFHEDIGIAYDRFDYPYDADVLRGDDGCSINLSEEFTVEKIYIYENDYVDLGPEIVSGQQGAVPWEGFEKARQAECVP